MEMEIKRMGTKEETFKKRNGIYDL